MEDEIDHEQDAHAHENAHPEMVSDVADPEVRQTDRADEGEADSDIQKGNHEEHDQGNQHVVAGENPGRIFE